MNEQDQLTICDRITDLEDQIDYTHCDINKSLIIIMVALVAILVILAVRL